jgi:hypothetical protein
LVVIMFELSGVSKRYGPTRALTGAWLVPGALPSALLAILVQGLFELLERTLVPKGLRLKPES